MTIIYTSLKLFPDIKSNNNRFYYLNKFYSYYDDNEINAYS